MGCLKKNPGRSEGDLLETGRALGLRVALRLTPGKGSEPENFRGDLKRPFKARKMFWIDSAIGNGQNTG